MAQKVTSTDIKLALKEFHNGKPSYFITECKTCSTYFPDPQGLLKFDGLAITKSYTKPNIIGYEIKVSRNDFLQDNKWHLYLQYCNEFYFVVPKGLVKKERRSNVWICITCDFSNSRSNSSREFLIAFVAGLLGIGVSFKVIFFVMFVINFFIRGGSSK